jgi:hypothetical protein
MPQLFVPQDLNRGSQEPSSAAVDALIAQQKKRDTVQAIVSSVLLVVGIGCLLWLFKIIPWGVESKTIVTYNAPLEKKEEVERPEINQRARPRPAGPKSSMSKVIASTVPSPVAVPVPENPVPEGPFGISDDFGDGFGDGEGDGDGGGGASFFGSNRKGKRVAFLVDYSGSMGSDIDGGSTTRMQALKKELVRSIQGLSKGMKFTVIFFSHHAWTLETEGPDYADNGWNGLGDPPVAPWYPASERLKDSVSNQVKSMPAQGNTNWYSPLKVALTMNPPPNIIYLLSDGEPRDGDSVLFDLDELNPRHIPIDTIAFELPGSPAGMLMEIAKTTGGKFSMVYKGKVLGGSAAERYTSSKYDD